MWQSNFTITRTKHAERCEICHQADLLEPQSGQCQRCQDLSVSITANSATLVAPIMPPSFFSLALATTLSIVCATVVLGNMVLSVAFLKTWGLSLLVMDFYMSHLILNFFTLLLNCGLYFWFLEESGIENSRGMTFGRVVNGLCIGVSLGNVIGIPIAFPSIVIAIMLVKRLLLMSQYNRQR